MGPAWQGHPALLSQFLPPLMLAPSLLLLLSQSRDPCQPKYLLVSPAQCQPQEPTPAPRQHRGCGRSHPPLFTHKGLQFKREGFCSWQEPLGRSGSCFSSPRALTRKAFTYAAASKAMFYTTTSSRSLYTILGQHRTSKAGAQPDFASWTPWQPAAEMPSCSQVTHTQASIPPPSMPSTEKEDQPNPN